MNASNYRFDSPGDGMRQAREARRVDDVNALIGILTGTDLMGRVAAAEYLGELRAREAVVPLVRCLVAQDALLRMGVLKALGNIGESSVADNILCVGLEDADFLVRCAAAEALVVLSDRRAVAVFRALLEDDLRDPQGFRKHFRRYAFAHLVRLGAIESISTLEATANRVGVFEKFRLRREIGKLKANAERSAQRA